MQLSKQDLSILGAVFRASSATRPISAQRLALELRLPRDRVGARIEHLASAGLLDAERLRLTFSGLAFAAAFARAQRAGTHPRPSERRRRRRSAA